MTNFDIFLTESKFAPFAEVAVSAEKILNIDTAACVLNCRRCVEFAVKWMYSVDSELVLPWDDKLVSLMSTDEFRDVVDDNLLRRMDFIRKLGNTAAHDSWARTAKGYKERRNVDFNYFTHPIIPQKVMWELNKFIDDDTIVTTDVGQNQMWAMHFLDIKRPRQFLSSGSFGTMGFGLPAAIGAKAARPDCRVATVVGDGGLQMVIQELATSVAEDLPVVIVLLNNGWLGMVKQWQKLFWDKRYSETLLEDDPDFVQIAKAYRAEGITVERAGEVEDALKFAFDCGKTCIVDIHVDPEEDILPMLPPDPSIPPIEGRCAY